MAMFNSYVSLPEANPQMEESSWKDIKIVGIYFSTDLGITIYIYTMNTLIYDIY